jgi:hypothetical protein
MRMRDVKAVENFMAMYVGKDCIENEEGFTEVNGPGGSGILKLRELVRGRRRREHYESSQAALLRKN